MAISILTVAIPYRPNISFVITLQLNLIYKQIRCTAIAAMVDTVSASAEMDRPFEKIRINGAECVVTALCRVGCVTTK